MKDPKEIARLKWISKIQQSTIDDILKNSQIAESILHIFLSIKGNEDRTRLLSQQYAIRKDWTRISASQLNTSRLVRLMALQFVDQSELQTYLYATQYIFLGETYVQFCIDLFNYICDSLSGQTSVDWDAYLNVQANKTVHVKLASLHSYGIDCFSDLYDRHLRNSLAHGKYEIDKLGNLKSWSRRDESDVRILSMKELVGKYDDVSDLTQITSLVFGRCMSEEFLTSRMTP